MLRKNLPLIVLTLGVLLQTSPVPLRAWTLGPAGLIPTSISAGNVPAVSVTQADFDSDGIPENLAVTDGNATIVSGSRIVWQSPQAWTVIQAAITDLNHDNMPEVALLVWRPFRPWPVDQWLPYGGRIANFHDAGGNSCHIILIGWRGHEYGELWAGSALAEPVKSFAATDLNGDGRQELVTLEGTYTDPGPRPETPEGSAPARALKVWEWNGFGFTVISTIEGTFDKMFLVRADAGPILILVP
jgi:hypothetical protein